jgi:flagellin
MSNSIQTNVDSTIAQENLRVNGEFQSRTIQRLTSGYRINSSGDDAAGLAVANKFRTDVAELQQGVRNANDGISALQIVDGGLNNISKMLDRLKTLATQSASATFSGSRETLNAEYQTLLREIDRQAQNIGLGTGAVGGRYSNNIDVYIGGGSGVQSNAKVTVDLQGSRVDSQGLGILSTNILGGAGVVLDAAVNLNTGGPFLAGGSEDFIFETTAGQKTVRISGGTAGITGQQAIDQFNQQLAGTGISALVNSDGNLSFYGDKQAFNVYTNATGATAGTELADASLSARNSNMYYLAGTVDLSTALAADATMSVTINGATITVNLANGDDVDDVISKANAALNPYSVYAVKDSTGTHFDLQGTAQFQVTGSATVTAGGTSANPAAPAGTSDVSNALGALAALTAAVTNLGGVQGKIGTGQNQLQYAIQLAQSQVASFSAAESRIRDADIAAEAANLTKAQVLQQSSLAALSQANAAPQAIMALLRQ